MPIKMFQMVGDVSLNVAGFNSQISTIEQQSKRVQQSFETSTTSIESMMKRAASFDKQVVDRTIARDQVLSDYETREKNKLEKVRTFHAEHTASLITNIQSYNRRVLQLEKEKNDKLLSLTQGIGARSQFLTGTLNQSNVQQKAAVLGAFGNKGTVSEFTTVGNLQTGLIKSASARYGAIDTSGSFQDQLQLIDNKIEEYWNARIKSISEQKLTSTAAYRNAKKSGLNNGEASDIAELALQKKIDEAQAQFATELNEFRSRAIALNQRERTLVAAVAKQADDLIDEKNNFIHAIEKEIVSTRQALEDSTREAKALDSGLLRAETAAINRVSNYTNRYDDITNRAAINRDVLTSQAGARTLDAQSSLNANREDLARRAIQSSSNFNSSVGQIADKVVTTTAVLAGLTAGVIKFGSTWEGEFTRASNNTSMTIEQIAEMKKAVESTASATGQELTKTAEGYRKIENFGFSAADATKVFAETTKLAVAYGDDLGATSELTAKALVLYQGSANDASRYTNVFARSAALSSLELSDFTKIGGQTLGMLSSLGVSFTEASAILTTFTKLGLNPSEAGTQLRNLVQKIISPTKDVKEILKDITTKTGVDLAKAFSYTGLQANGVEGAFRLLRKAAKEMGVDAEQLATKVFPNLRGTIGALILTTDKGFKTLVDTSGELKTVFTENIDNVNERYALSMGTSETQVKRTTVALQLLSTQIAQAATPAIIAISNSLSSFNEMLNGLSIETKTSIAQFALVTAGIVATTAVVVKAATSISLLRLAIVSLNVPLAAQGGGALAVIKDFAGARGLMNALPLIARLGAGGAVAAGAIYLIARSYQQLNKDIEEAENGWKREGIAASNATKAKYENTNAALQMASSLKKNKEALDGSKESQAAYQKTLNEFAKKYPEYVTSYTKMGDAVLDLTKLVKDLRKEEADLAIQRGRDIQRTNVSKVIDVQYDIDKLKDVKAYINAYKSDSRYTLARYLDMAENVPQNIRDLAKANTPINVINKILDAQIAEFVRKKAEFAKAGEKWRKEVGKGFENLGKMTLPAVPKNTGEGGEYNEPDGETEAEKRLKKLRATYMQLQELHYRFDLNPLTKNQNDMGWTLALEDMFQKSADAMSASALEDKINVLAFGLDKRIQDKMTVELLGKAGKNIAETIAKAGESFGDMLNKMADGAKDRRKKKALQALLSVFTIDQDTFKEAVKATQEQSEFIDKIKELNTKVENDLKPKSDMDRLAEEKFSSIGIFSMADFDDMKFMYPELTSIFDNMIASLNGLSEAAKKKEVSEWMKNLTSSLVELRKTAGSFKFEDMSFGAFLYGKYGFTVDSPEYKSEADKFHKAFRLDTGNRLANSFQEAVRSMRQKYADNLPMPGVKAFALKMFGVDFDKLSKEFQEKTRQLFEADNEFAKIDAWERRMARAATTFRNVFTNAIDASISRGDNFFNTIGKGFKEVAIRKVSEELANLATDGFISLAEKAYPRPKASKSAVDTITNGLGAFDVSQILATQLPIQTSLLTQIAANTAMAAAGSGVASAGPVLATSTGASSAAGTSAAMAGLSKTLGYIGLAITANQMLGNPVGKAEKWFRKRILGRATGGAMHVGNDYVVGEFGPEIVRMKDNGYAFSTGSRTASGPASNTVNHYGDIHVTERGNAEAVYNALFQKISAASSGAY